MPFFGGQRVSEITTSKINYYIQKRQEKGAENATINRELAAIKRMFNLAARSTPPKVSRVPHIKKLAEHNVRKGFFEHDDFIALRQALPKELQGFVTFGYKTGWRFSEIAGITWAQVDRVNGIVRLEPAKPRTMKGEQ